jgi:Bacterial Ig domain
MTPPPRPRNRRTMPTRKRTRKKTKGTSYVFRKNWRKRTMSPCFSPVDYGTLTLATLDNLSIGAGANGGASMTFTGTADAVNAVLNGLVYLPTTTYVGDDTLNIEVNDTNTNSTGEDPATGTIGVVVGGPTLVVPLATQMIDAGNNLQFNSTNDNVISVGDGASGATLKVSLSASNGTLTLFTEADLSITPTGADGTSFMTISGTATDINAALDGLTYSPTSNIGGDEIDITVDDSASSLSGNGQATGAIDIIYGPIVNVPSSQDTDSSTSIQFSSMNGNAITVADPNGVYSGVTVALAVAYGTLALGPDSSGVTVTSSSGGSMSFYGSVNNVNEALDGLEYTPDSSLTADGTLYDTLTISVDDSGPNPATGSVSIEVDPAATGPSVVAPQSIATNVSTSMEFSTSYSDPIVVGDSGGSGVSLTVGLSVGNGTLSLATTSGITITAGSNNSQAMTLTGDASEINSALNGLTYAPTTGSNAGDDLSVTVDDPTTLSAGTGQAGADISIAFGPTVSVPGVQATLSSTPLVFSNNDGDPITVGDSEGTTTDMTVNLSVAIGTLALGADTTDVMVTGSSSNMTLYGMATDINTALDGLTYMPGSVVDNQDALNITVNDPTTLGAATASVPIIVGGPVATMPATQSTNSAIPEVFSAEAGNGIVVFDPIAGSSGLKLTLSTSDGTLTLSQTTGLTFHSGTANGESSMVISGTLQAINAALDGLTYAQSSDTYVGTATITAEAYDSSATGATTVATAVNVDVGGPSITVSGNQWTFSGTSLTLSSSNSDAIQVGDPGGGSTSLTVALASSDGTMTLASTTGLTFTAGTSNGHAHLSFTGTVSAINAALNSGLTYAPSSGFLGGMAIDVTADETSATMPETAYGEVNVSVGGQVVAVPVSATTTQGTATTIDVLDSASEVGTGTLSIDPDTLTVTGGSSVGTASINTSTTPATINFTPNSSFSGTATISYKITDGIYFSTATITVTVTPTPTINAAALNATTSMNMSVTIPLLAGIPGATIQSVSTPDFGSVAISGSSVIYTPNRGYTGPANFSYTIVDAYGNTSTASVDLSVMAVPTDYPPLAAPEQNYNVPYDQSITMDVLAQDSGYINGPYDLQGPYVEGTTADPDGVLEMSGFKIVYTPPGEWSGNFVYYTYQLTDIFGDVVTGLVTLGLGDGVVNFYVNNKLESYQENDNAIALGERLPVFVSVEYSANFTPPATAELFATGALILTSETAAPSTGTTSLDLSGSQTVYLLGTGANFTLQSGWSTDGSEYTPDGLGYLGDMVSKIGGDAVVVTFGSGTRVGGWTNTVVTMNGLNRTLTQVPLGQWAPMWESVSGSLGDAVLDLGVIGQSASNGRVLLSSTSSPNAQAYLAISSKSLTTVGGGQIGYFSIEGITPTWANIKGNLFMEAADNPSPFLNASAALGTDILAGPSNGFRVAGKYFGFFFSGTLEKQSPQQKLFSHPLIKEFYDYARANDPLFDPPGEYLYSAAVYDADLPFVHHNVTTDTNLKIAFQEARQAYNNGDRIVIIGWSRGGIYGIVLSQLLAAAGIPVYYMGLIDPVGSYLTGYTPTIPASVQHGIVINKTDGNGDFDITGSFIRNTLGDGTFANEPIINDARGNVTQVSMSFSHQKVDPRYDPVIAALKKDAAANDIHLGP